MTTDRLKRAADDLRKIMNSIEETNKTLALLDENRKTMERETLPELFAEAGVKSIELDNGDRITLSTLAEGSLPKDPILRQFALNWLVANGFENLIECKVTGSWARGERAVAQAEYERLAALGNAKVSLDEGINPKTLGARIRDRVVAGLPTPLGQLGVSVFQRARFTKKTGTVSNDQ